MMKSYAEHNITFGRKEGREIHPLLPFPLNWSIFSLKTKEIEKCHQIYSCVNWLKNLKECIEKAKQNRAWAFCFPISFLKIIKLNSLCGERKVA